MASHSEKLAWQSKRSFVKTNEQMLQDGLLSDVTLLAGSSKKEVKAHKFILASRSTVFFAMFCGPLAESSKTIDVPDIEPEIFLEFLRFLYTEHCTINENNALHLLYSAKKYDTARLAEKCIEYLRMKISVDNVCVILQHAYTFDEGELEKKCFDFVLKHGEDVLESEGLPTISKAVFQKIIEADYLIANEFSVYNACKRWAIWQIKQKSGKSENLEHPGVDLRAEIGELVYSIRFPTMPFEKFVKHVATEDILSREEKLSVFEYAADAVDRTTQYFKSSARKIQRTEISRFSSENISAGWNSGINPDVINFQVSNKARLIGIKLFSPYSKGTIEGVVKLLTGTSTLASRSGINIEYGCSKISEEVLFDKGYILEPGREYTVYASLSGKGTHYGHNGKEKSSLNSFVVSFSDNENSTTCTCSERGQFHALIFEVLKW